VARFFQSVLGIRKKQQLFRFSLRKIMEKFVKTLIFLNFFGNLGNFWKFPSP
jgi:hypothetical protein